MPPSHSSPESYRGFVFQYTCGNASACDLAGMTPEQFIDRLKRLQVLRGKLPGQVGEMARSIFLDNYRKGGFEDQTFVPWVERKPVPAGKTDKNKGRALLVKSGKLRRSIRVMEKGEGYVIIGSDVSTNTK